MLNKFTGGSYPDLDEARKFDLGVEERFEGLGRLASRNAAGPAQAAHAAHTTDKPPAFNN